MLEAYQLRPAHSAVPMSQVDGYGILINSLLQQLDADASGKIRRQDFWHVLKKLDVFEAQDLQTLVTLADADGTGFIDYRKFVGWLMGDVAAPQRSLSLPKAAAAAGGIDAWNQQSSIAQLSAMLEGMCKATTVEGVLKEVQAVMSLGHYFWAYAYMRRLYNVNLKLYFAALQAKPSLLLPVVYTPTVGEACQKFGVLPLQRRGCYLAVSDRGRLKEALQEYAEAELSRDANGQFLCDCIVFTDGGRILGLGDLGAWGMPIPIGKLDLYTVCAGVNPHRTIPVVIDAGCSGPEGNTNRLQIRDHDLYAGLRQPRETQTSATGMAMNSAYYSEKSIIAEFMAAATELFGKGCLLQFEDFSTADAFRLLAEYRDRHLCYNDDIQGTAAVGLAAFLGAMRLRQPACKDLAAELRRQTFLFHGAGSANLGIMTLLRDEAGVPAESIFATNKEGLIWLSEDGTRGNFSSEEQRSFAQRGEPSFDTRNLVALAEHARPTFLIGATGVCPNCFTKPLVEALLRFSERPVVFALSNPKTQAEITAENAYRWSAGKVIFGSGTWFPPVEVGGRRLAPGQVNNVYIFPGVSFGAVCCQASSIPERFFLDAAEAVAKSLDAADIASDSVVPARDRIREVSLDVAAAVVWRAQEMGLAGRTLGASLEAVKQALAKMRWTPDS
mmetsp:Transcript_41839/g.126666  ORF Transcript_41839/g.126666 Transcript_41839/m.126666 type:complete len:670 (-) Transcript_41839:184-2193(-)